MKEYAVQRWIDYYWENVIKYDYYESAEILYEEYTARFPKEHYRIVVLEVLKSTTGDLSIS